MANNIDEETIGICDYDGELLSDIHVISVSARPTARLCKHPLESGGTTIDNKVLDPITLNVKAYIKWTPDKKAVNVLNRMWRDRTATFYSVVTRDGKYNNLAVISIPHRETPERFDVFDFDIMFQEVTFGTSTSEAEAAIDPSNGSTVRSGRIGGSLGW